MSSNKPRQSRVGESPSAATSAATSHQPTSRRRNRILQAILASSSSQQQPPILRQSFSSGSADSRLQQRPGRRNSHSDNDNNDGAPIRQVRRHNSTPSLLPPDSPNQSSNRNNSTKYTSSPVISRARVTSASSSKSKADTPPKAETMVIRHTNHNHHNPSSSSPTLREQRERREARRDRRFKRRLLLLGLLTMAFSPSLVLLYYTTLATSSSVSSATFSSEGDTALHVLGQLRPEQVDPHFGLPQVIVKRAQRKRGTMQCVDPTTGPCCAPWSYKTDDWWSQHYDWHVVRDNQTHTCFQAYNNKDRTAFLQQLHQVQWNTQQCSSGWQRNQLLSGGYAAALSSVSRSFYAAFQQHKPFQYNKQTANARWNFAVNVSQHWAHCANQDLSCYFLPLGGCPRRTITTDQGHVVGLHSGERGEKPSIAQSRDYRWLRAFAFRPRHMIRHHLVKYMQQHAPKVPTPCSVIHVRRTNVAFGTTRRYVAVKEYLEVGHIPSGKAVVILTDDASTLEEIQEMPNYHWVYLSRPRFRGVEGGLEGYIASDPAKEVLSILAELQLASQCHKLVHGTSAFVELIQEAMLEAQDNVEFVELNDHVQDTEPLEAKERARRYFNTIRQRNSTVTRRIRN